jgi:ketosteroid isomerase-like protein
LLTLLAFPMSAFDAKSEVAQLNETMDRATAVKDVDTYSKCLTADFFSAARNGAIRDLKSSLDFFKSGSVPADLKKQILKTSVYGDTVLELVRETYTGNSGDKIETNTTYVYVKQSGSWKLALRSSTTVPASK